MALSSAPDESTVSLFEQNWRVYRILVEENFLFHREVYARVHELLTNLEKPFRFLDLGCGDAAESALALKETSVAAYHGVDLAPGALAVAQKMVASLPCPVSLEVGDYTDALRRRTDPADVVWIGLSLHHCRHDAKEAVLHDIRRILVPGGLLLFYENTSPDGESRDDWLARWDLQRPARGPRSRRRSYGHNRGNACFLCLPIGLGGKRTIYVRPSRKHVRSIPQWRRPSLSRSERSLKAALILKFIGPPKRTRTKARQ